ncbi:Rrf2 family protein [Desulfobaculum xiamenense]|uniref:Rrf2 family protein n=1 Tax=Desulfobaculum xiamenense TaxID=995050 RepID=A0A846QRK5_9BACT|nr:Rrf2 family transcriptional regulator [Desulfobaculum xiamenense]NJB67299.1 Rrf2 family protein [Desulfobaculum xiamenense]
MKLSARSRYATRLLLDLASHMGEGPLRASLLSEHTGISVQFIEQIIKPLKKARLVSSTRGATGGHTLAVGPEDITLARIVDIMEDGINLTKCCAEPDSCERSAECRTRNAWLNASRALRDGLAAITLADLMNSPVSKETILSDED